MYFPPSVSKLNSEFDNAIDRDVEYINGRLISRAAKNLCYIKDGKVYRSYSFRDIIKNASPMLNIDGTNVGNVVLSLGDIRFAITRISIDDNPNTTNRSLCIEWSADGKDYKSYIDVDFSEEVIQ